MTHYIGRFAPSPSGPLHFGSLMAALGSYFQAKSRQGQWLVRMEDLDPPREQPGAADSILRTLEDYHLEWDGHVVYQSQRHELYQAQIDQWFKQGEAYYCQCTRKQVKGMGGFYDGHCRTLNITQPLNCSVRLHIGQPVFEFTDLKHGKFVLPAELAQEDFIIKRRDGLYAYNLAVVLDDIEQGVTEVVRGADLIEPTGRQMSLYHQLNQPLPSYLHLPLALDNNGNKLSKQNHAPAIDGLNKHQTLLHAMQCLGFAIEPSLRDGSMAEIILWGVENWSIKQLPESTKVTPRFSNGSV
ncbi:tRNA glutamyl-Q(34) synthetase GluQRS [Vibrio sp. FNV 38]|nr:tRNA glutamyl-Q(34) synthetase GluQRS [Vibrio sp. FNV 38]